MLPDVKLAQQTPKALNLEGPYSEDQLAALPLEELKRLAIAEGRAAQNAESENPAVVRAKAEAARQSANAKAEGYSEGGNDEMFVAERTIEGAEGAGAETFRGEGATKEEALEDLLDKIAEGKKNATLKIRQQQQTIASYEARQGRIDEDSAYISAQLIQAGNPQGLDQMIRKATGVGLAEIAETAKSHQAQLQAQRNNEEINSFLASHEDYVDGGPEGVRNGQVMRMRLNELNLPTTAENLHQVYVDLSSQGLLILKDGSNANTPDSVEVASPREQQFRDERGRFTQPAQQAQPKRKSSGISSQSSNRGTPRTGLSERDAYDLPLEELRERANAQLKETFGSEEPEYRTRISGTHLDRVR